MDAALHSETVQKNLQSLKRKILQLREKFNEVRKSEEAEKVKESLSDLYEKITSKTEPDE